MKIRLLGIALATLLGAAPCPAASANADSALAADRSAEAESSNLTAPADLPGTGLLTAQSMLPSDGDVDADTPDVFNLIARTALSLGVVLMVIWAALVLLRRFSGGSGPSRRASQIHVLDRTYLAPKRAVYVVQIGSRTLALGVTDTQITQLAELDGDEFSSSSTPATPAFAGVFDGALRRLGRSKAESEELSSEVSL